MTKHTPGPWRHVGLTMIQGAGDPHKYIPGIVANVTPPGTEHRADVCAANAHLIAAAPDLLAALKEIAEIEHGAKDDRAPLRYARHIARAVIAKAEGGAA